MEEPSLTGRLWRLEEVAPDQIAQIVEGVDLDPITARCLAARARPPEAAAWLTPSLDHLHEPYEMRGREAAVDRIRSSVTRNESVRIVTDYDVDGTTSSLILQSVLKVIGHKGRVDYHIPDRFDEGYGFSTRAAQKAGEEGVGLLVTADIGVRDHEAVALAQGAGVDVIVCDHHLPSGASVPPEALAVLCPPQEGCSYPNQALAACGVSLKLAQALLSQHPKRELLLRSMLKLAAIGTVADVVDLSTRENRAIVTLGLEELRAGRHSPGLAALIGVCGLNGHQLQASDLGFRLGPRINAAGRIAEASKVVELFQERDPAQAQALAHGLDQLNRQRQGLQQRLVEACLEELPTPVPDFAVLWGPEEEGWHRGVVGIVAAKVRDRIHRPAAVVAVSGTEARGSVRSVPRIHAVRALDSVADLLDRYGGHPAAAGFSLPAARLPELKERLGAWVRDHTAEGELVPELTYAAECGPDELHAGLQAALARLGPFGKGNPEPLIRVHLPTGAGLGTMGKGHLKVRVGLVDGVWWQGGRHLKALQSGPIELLGHLGMDHWNGRARLRFTIEDGRPASG